MEKPGNRESAARRLQELLDRILDGSCTDLEQQEFAGLLEGQHQLAPELIEQLRFHSLLQWQCGNVKSSKAKAVAPDDRSAIGSSLRFPGMVKPPTLQSKPPQRGDIFRFQASRWRWAAAVTLFAVIGGIGAWYGLQRGRDWKAAVRESADPIGKIKSGGPHEPRDRVAEIFENRSVVWSGDNSALEGGGGAVAPGHLEMKSGTLTLKFRSGATMSATGDVSMRIVSDMLVLLDRGQATANVPQWAKGFTIKTREVEVVDLGTQFGVVARPGGSTDVVVFEGKVDLKPTSAPDASQKRLNQGEGVRVSDQGAMDRIVELRRDADKGQWSTDEPDWSETTFKSIRDNIPSIDVPTYYQITPHGLEDDCQAYTDAPHEWNGLTIDGLPKFLEHADYVMTRNDYRYINDFQMTVELARPATVYVFFDHRVPPPQWLKDQFEKTEVNIGLDEGPWQPGDTKHTVGVGGGESIDNVFSVWSRRCEKPETLKFGAMGPKPGARAMYGIAAKPLE